MENMKWKKSKDFKSPRFIISLLLFTTTKGRKLGNTKISEGRLKIPIILVQ